MIGLAIGSGSERRVFDLAGITNKSGHPFFSVFCEGGNRGLSTVDLEARREFRTLWDGAGREHRDCLVAYSGRHSVDPFRSDFVPLFNENSFRTAGY
jgi:hypothetical protein